MDRFIGSVTQRAAYTDRVVVAQVSSDLPDDHRHGICGKFYPHIRVKVINGFDQTDTSDLKQVIYIFIVIRKTFDDT